MPVLYRDLKPRDILVYPKGSRAVYEIESTPSGPVKIVFTELGLFWNETFAYTSVVDCDVIREGEQVAA
jgi:hypothetical protein